MNQPARLGTWRCPSGNAVSVVLHPARDCIRDLTFTWDTTRSDEDYVFYLVEILPAVTRRAREYLELLGPALVIA